MTQKPTYEELEEKVQTLTRELEMSASKLRTLSEASFEAIFFSEKGICIDQNSAARRMFGYTLEEAVGRPGTEWILPEDREIVKNRMRENDTRPYQVRAQRKDGTVFPCEIQACSTQYQGRSIRVTALRDISEQMMAQEKTRESRQEIESIFRSAPTGIGVVSNRIITKVNDRVVSISGYSQEELVGKNARFLYPDETDYNYVGEEKYRQIRKYGTGTVETRWKRKDGQIIDVLMSSTPIDLTDYAKGVTFTVLDITESKKKELALLESETHYRTMMESLNDAVYICSADFKVEYMNSAMNALAVNGSLGGHCYQAVHGFDHQCPWCVHDRVIQGESVSLEVTLPGNDRSYHISNSPIKHTDGTVSKLIVYRDITDIKKMEDRLLHAQKMESIGNLAGGIAHDFNNLLFPIVGMAELLIEDFPPGTPHYENMNEILRAGKRGSDLVKQILSFSRQGEHSKVAVNLRQIIREVVKLSRASIPSDIEIIQHIKKDCGLIMANPTQLHQVAMNLVTNAYHAVEPTSGKIEITVQTRRLDAHELPGSPLEPGEYVLLSVRDNGTGISKPDLEKVFEPYFTTKKKGKGTGLGLSVVYGIVKDHKGFIDVDSELGKGTRFKVYFPLMELTSPQAVPENEHVLATGHERILLVDDEEPIIRLEEQMLKRLGYTICAMTSSLDALALFKKDPGAFDLVITDMTMPNMTGDKLATEMMSIRPDIPIIICTGFSERISKDVTRQIGAKGLLMKPVVRSDMARMVREALDDRLGR
ncbi:MAG: PAS domain-containing sensor histidine kinase [Desulfobacteraceae bacterium]|nr:MAG: PAS domain-containing sensor histidine kinase [Desulfobacteraceae bacterium]